jgi:hypothetical protein
MATESLISTANAATTAVAQPNFVWRLTSTATAVASPLAFTYKLNDIGEIGKIPYFTMPQSP